MPDSIKADVLFRRMREEHLRLVVVLDEYGGVTGIVTLSDLLELLVGDLDGGDKDAETEGN
ncbi:MAG: CBS domain-containing protein [Oscillospiraceae bacterium]